MTNLLQKKLIFQLFTSGSALVHKTPISSGQRVGFGYVQKKFAGEEKAGLWLYSTFIDFRTCCWDAMHRDCGVSLDARSCLSWKSWLWVLNLLVL